MHCLNSRFVADRPPFFEGKRRIWSRFRRSPGSDSHPFGFRHGGLVVVRSHTCLQGGTCFTEARARGFRAGCVGNAPKLIRHGLKRSGPASRVSRDGATQQFG